MKTTKQTRIAKITRTYTRTYSDNGQVKTYVEWIDTDGKSGRTEGDGKSGGLHLAALLGRATREGVKHEIQTW